MADDPIELRAGDHAGEPAVAPGPRAVPFKIGYRPELDGIRGFGMIFVLWAHGYFVWPELIHHMLPGLIQGVDMFFVLSGFLITTLLLQERERNGRVSFKGFYVRRALRLLPSLFTVLIAYFVYTLVTGKFTPDDLTTYLFIVFYFANYARVYFDQSDTMHLVFGQTWSLAVEEQYYLVFFPAFILMLRFVRTFRTVLVVLVGMLVAACLWRSYLNHTMTGDIVGLSPLYYRTDTRLDALLAGPIAAILIAMGVRNGRVVRILGPVALASVISFLWWGNFLKPWMFDWGFPVLELSWAMVIIWLVTAERPIIHPIMRWRPIVWIGRVSYEIYLWHLPVYYVIVMEWSQGPWVYVCAVAITLGLAAATYYGAAGPFLKMKRRSAARLRGEKPEV